jgi:hypothetical protein
MTLQRPVAGRLGPEQSSVCTRCQHGLFMGGDS